MGKIKNILSIIMILFYLSSSVLAGTRDFVKEHREIDREIAQDLEANQYTLADPFIVVNPYNLAPLTALLMFDTEKSVDVKIKVPGKNGKNSIEHHFLEKSKKHRIPVYGLYPGINKIEVMAGKEKAVIEIETENLSSGLVSLEVEKIDWKNVDKDFIISAPSIDNNLTIYDNSGDIRWYISEKKIGAAGPIKKLPNGNLLLTSEEQKKPPYYVTSLYEIDFLGKIYRKIDLKGYGHHDFLQLENGNILGLVDPIDKKTVEDYMMEYDKNGNIVKEWDFKKLIKLDDYKAQELYETYNFKGNKGAAIHDWAHANAFDYDKKDNSIIVSFRHLNAVIKFDYKIGKIIWIFADPNNPWLTEELKGKLLKTEDKNIYAYGQHAVKVLENGNILVYDNGNYRDLYSREIIKSSPDYNPNNNKTRALELKISNGKISKVWEHSLENGYTPFIGDVNKIGKNHYFINYGGIVEVEGKASDDILGVLVFGTIEGKLYGKMIETKAGKVVFEAKTLGQKDSTIYRANRINFYKEIGKKGEN